jgi:hypothetical protein
VGVAEGVVVLNVGIGPVYFSPSSPGVKTTTEQKPSVDVMSSVFPSDDLYTSYKQLPVSSYDTKDVKPCKIRECCIVQIAYYANGRLLLGVVYQNRILCRHSVNHSIGERECCV